MHFDYTQYKQKGFLLIWILIGVLVGGVILFTTIKLKPLLTPPSQSIVTPTPPPADASPAPTGAGETANWKTYESKQFGFSIKYPPELGVNDGAAKNTIDIGKGYETQAEALGRPSFMYISTIPDGFTGGAGEIYVYAPQVTKALLNMQVGETHQTFPYKRLPDITIDGVSAKIFDKLIPDKREIERELYPYKGGNTYMIGVIISSEDSSMTLEKFNQILSTFKFLK